MLEKCNPELCYDMSILIDRTIHSNRTDKVTLDKTIKEACVADAAILRVITFAVTRSGSSRRIQTSKERLLRIIWQLTTEYITPLVLSTTGIIPNKLHYNLKSLIFVLLCTV
jgi:hypothetical protein